ncbi:unnamed protein product [Dracunculus medinensis]|uniref:G-protein coupled receptors family 1 profile domain-containing protein n=1 Tax=Dracunculus medinensis TaxID=318479 RepID=A0A3P7T168_DRAME|nr:unnamed protein product [Dracunculus medinensis]
MVTLRSPTLQTVPFMYIRSIAIFDFIGLCLISLHFGLELVPKPSYSQMFYTTYVEECLINAFLVASVYCALLLTSERYLLITHPHKRRTTDPKYMAQMKIAILLLCCVVLHLPMAAQNKLRNNNGKWHKGNNIEFLCSEPVFTLYNYYKMSREFLRFLSIIIMVILNIIIARKLQITKKKRRLMILRPTTNPLNTKKTKTTTFHVRYSSQDHSTRTENSLMRSFTEKKLTALMVAICLIFMIGNLPQTFVMVLQNEARETNYEFQFIRNIANLFEVLNHCLNFYVFCMASSEYMRAFITKCMCLHGIFSHITWYKRSINFPENNK